MKIYIIGKNGQLGNDISLILSKKHKVYGGGRDYFDIEKTDMFLEYIKGKFDIIINTAAFHDVNKCEYNIKRAMFFNSELPCKIASFCYKHSMGFIHFSTDYVFDGKKHNPYIEEDIPNPLNNYGFSKYEGEKCILRVHPESLILRVSGLYSKNISRVKGYNFITRIIEKCNKQKEIYVVDDQILTPTYTLNIAKQLDVIIENNINGIVHSTDEGEVSWYEFADFIVKFLQLDCSVKPIKTENKKPIRPSYSVLDNKVLKDMNINIMKHWKDSLISFLGDISEDFCKGNRM